MASHPYQRKTHTDELPPDAPMSALDGYVQLQRRIKIDPDFVALSPAGQWLYFQLLIDVNHIGVADWNPKRLTLRAETADLHYVLTGARELTESLFAVLDEASGEIFIRSYMKYDGAHKQPNTCTSMVNAFGSVASMKIRQVAAYELGKILAATERAIASGSIEGDKVKATRKRWNTLETITEYPAKSADQVYKPMEDEA